MKLDGFDWDEGNRQKCCKHGVSLEEIEDLFSAQPGMQPDPLHSRVELRIRAIGQTRSGRWLLVAFTVRRRDHRTLVRPVSARYMHAKEVRHYEKAQATSNSDKR